jgi:exonuclease III
MLKILHQNICGLRNKYKEILCHLKDQTPHILCFTEHHLDGNEIIHLNLDNYSLGAYYSRKYFKKGGTCIYVHNSLKTININLDKYCYDKDIEACAVYLNTTCTRICVLSVYRSPNSNYNLFLEKLELILQKLCKTNVKVVICGDINVNYMENGQKKVKLDDMLSSYKLNSVIDFPTRIGKNTATIIDNIFLDPLQFIDYDIFAMSNGLSDHEAQMLIVYITSQIDKNNDVYYTRSINEANVADFRLNLSYENWEQVYNNTDINTGFNQFLIFF